jgi:hypothetical protein
VRRVRLKAVRAGWHYPVRSIAEVVRRPLPRPIFLVRTTHNKFERILRYHLALRPRFASLTPALPNPSMSRKKTSSSAWVLNASKTHLASPRNVQRPSDI